ncbi:type III-B CRISPR-associated protein Cas10/Cmr2 [Chloroflexus sp.]|uniref:type III-B CRISPR-associated protein Cas10/Cmr2 n=1 Tax=Chloroflexus sp. TaxID=1904827 RepID=UPI00260D7260|nr:type III-B CRISPR-associated protein Cas10/Cmr2 [uncultured Chloroflexus sp.]
MLNRPDYCRIIAECLSYPGQPSDELLNVVTTILNAGSQPSAASLWELNNQIGAHPRRLALVYGGATRIKSYVFEAPKLPEIRGASALLDWIGEQEVHRIWHRHFPLSSTTGNPPHPYVIYASGGSFLAFTPCCCADALATEVERVYTEHTLTANSVAVAACFDLLELRYGRLFHPDRPGQIYWIDDFLTDCQDADLWEELKHYYYPPAGQPPDRTDETALRQRFFNRKTFGELVTILTTMYHRRRDERASHGETRHLPHYELMPWDEKCRSSDVRPAVIRVQIGNDTRLLSEASARKLAVGRLVKGVAVGSLANDLKPWNLPADLKDQSWEQRWQQFLTQHQSDSPYAQDQNRHHAIAAGDLSDIGAASEPKRYISVIYADGNNIGRLMATLTTPEVYHQVSRALSEVAQQAVFTALANHLRPVQVARQWIHPFEILTIGGDDLFIVVPAHKAFDIAIAIAQLFEQELTQRFKQIAASASLNLLESQSIPLRYNGTDPVAAAVRSFRPAAGLSAGVLIAQENTPFFLVRDLVEELLKKAKKLATTNARQGFFGGTVDFMVLKSVPMVSDDITSFRAEALRDTDDSPQRLTARPYTWAEFAGLLATVRELKRAQVPRSQLYRLRSILDRNREGVFDSALEYLYTRSRLHRLSDVLIKHVDYAWCYPSPNQPQRIHVPPWSSRTPLSRQVKPRYETIWADMLEAYEFVAE